MDTRLNTKRILIYLAFAFGIPWAAALATWLSGWMAKDALQAAGVTNLIFISTPWLANLATRLLTREGWGNLKLRPNLKRGWRFYLAAWLLPVAATAAGASLFYLLFPESFDPSLGALQKLVTGDPAAAGLDPWVIFLSVTMSTVLVSTLINSVVSMGEELGWRGYLLPKLVERSDRASSRKAALLTGLIHGVWHWPLIFMSMSLLPGVTFLTPVVYLVFTCSMSVLLSWVTLRSGSAWPAALGHGAINATSALPGFLLKGSPIPLLGPDPTGLIGGCGYVILALALLLNRRTLAAEKQVQPARVLTVVGVKTA